MPHPVESKFAEATQRAARVLKDKEVKDAMAVVEEFFVANQEDLKEYFDAKTLEETQREMAKRVEEVKALMGSEVGKSNKVPQFLQQLQAVFEDEFRKRQEEMAEEMDEHA